MYTSEELNLKLLSELRKICIEIGIKDVRTASKIELIEKILESQSSASIFNTPASVATDSPTNPLVEQPLFKEDKGLKNRKRLTKTEENKQAPVKPKEKNLKQTL
jgi:transcription termination factor Rho